MSAWQQPATGPNSFQQRAITATIQLGEGVFGDSGTNTTTLSGLKVEATINKAGAPSFDSAEVRIYGVQPSILNAVGQLGVQPFRAYQGDILTLTAGDSVNGMVTVFSGYMQFCWQNYDGQPESVLEIQSYTGADLALYPAVPTSYPGGADVATIMASLAAQMGLSFENSGVQVQLASPYFAGTALQQARKCAEAANIAMYIDSQTQTLAIWPKTGTRGGLVPLISAASGMIGYPTFMRYGLRVSTLFNPNIRIGGNIQIQSSLGTATLASTPSTQAPQTAMAGGPNGTWFPLSITHELSSWLTDGPWMTTVECTRTLYRGSS